MSRISKTFALFLMLTIAMSCQTMLMIVPASAQTISQPSVPQFTVKFVDLSYDVPTTTSIDQNNGQTITNQGYHLENRTIQLTIKNQPFTSYIQDGENMSFYYNVREKGAYAENWTTLFHPDNYYFWTQSNTGYTTFVFLIDQNAPPFWDELARGGTVDFQVQAMIGYASRTIGFASWYFNGTKSDWSPTQTATIPASFVSSSLNPSPTVPEVPYCTLVIVSILGIVLLVALFFKKVLGKEERPEKKLLSM